MIEYDFSGREVQSPRFKQGTAEYIAQCESNPFASRAQFRSKQIHNIVAGGEIENQIRGHVLVQSFANRGIAGFRGWVQDKMSQSAERIRSMDSPTFTSR